MQMLGSRGGACAPSNDNFNQDQPADNTGSAGAKKSTPAVAGEFDDDIPF